MRFSRHAILDLKLLGAIAAALMLLAVALDPKPVQKLAHPRFARGEPGVQITSSSFSPTAQLMVTTNTDGAVTLRGISTAWPIERSLDFPGFAQAAAFSPDGRFVAAVGFEPTICIWDLSSSGGVPATTAELPIERANHVVFSPDGHSLVVTTAIDGAILLWDVESRRERATLRHTCPVVNVAVSPDGKWLATSGRDDRPVYLWDLEAGVRHVLFEDRPARIMALTFSPDGSVLASASVDEHQVRLWDVKTRRACRVFAGHTCSVNSVAFSPDGRLLATAGNDGIVGLWTVSTGERRASLDGHANSLRTVAFSPDGRTLALTTLDDDDIRFWDVAEICKLPLARFASNEIRWISEPEASKAQTWPLSCFPPPRLYSVSHPLIAG
jgi:WD40 repeat protein